ncbi:MAG: DUF3034 family protein [Rhizomicrobium sp.]
MEHILMRAGFTGLLALAALAATPAAANSWLDGGTFDEGKLLATGGVSQVEGAGGGGLATWALISGYGTNDGVGVNAHDTFVDLPDYTLQSPGAAIGLFDRVELSYAHEIFNTESTGAALGLGEGYTFDEDIWGAKVKLLGDAIYAQDTLLPQVAAGIEYKHADRGAVIHAIGGKSNAGTDFYLSATKLILSESLLLDATLRETKANQFGLLGFGGDRNNDYSTQFEGSAALLLSRQWAIGAEFRTKPSNLGIAREDNAWDAFAAFFLNKHLSATLAYVDLGNIVIHDHQQGVYLSLQVGL